MSRIRYKQTLNIFIIIQLFIPGIIFGSEIPFQLKIKAPNDPLSEVFLANYLSGKAYIIDTIRLNKKGEGIFSRKEKLIEGMYLLSFNKKKNIDFLVEKNQHLNFQIDSVGKKECIQMKGARQTEAFNEYIQFLASMKKMKTESNSKENRIKNNPALLRKRPFTPEEIDNRVLKYQSGLSARFKDQLLGTFIRGSMQVQIPENLKKDSTSDQVINSYIKNHYWDHLPLSDQRIWSFNYLPEKLMYYLQNVVYQHHDSITKEALLLVEKSRDGDPMAFRLMLSYMFNFAGTSKLMGIENLYIQLAQLYYLSGLANWVNKEFISDLKHEISKIENNSIGKTAYNLPYQTETSDINYLYNIQAPLMLVLFYDPDCGHCINFMKELIQSNEEYKSKGVKILVYNTNIEQQKWNNFRNNFQFENIIHGWDPTRKSDYWKYFDTSVTPVIYLLNQEKKIIARKINVQTLNQLLQTMK